MSCVRLLFQQPQPGRLSAFVSSDSRYAPDQKLVDWMVDSEASPWMVVVQAGLA